MSEIVLTPKSIILTIGVTHSGKSHFCKNFLIPRIKEADYSYQYLSSDDIRRELLNDNLHKHDPKMSHVNKQTFSILENYLDNCTSYPVNTDFVIVDAMNLSSESRRFVLDVAKKNHYKVYTIIFDYKNRDDFFAFVDKDEKVNKRVLADCLFTFKTKTLKTLDKKDFERVYFIKSLDFSDYKITFKFKPYLHPEISLHKNYCIVGDVHLCLDELIECVTDNKGILNSDGCLIRKAKLNDKEEYYHHILVGDYLDKGDASRTKDMIEFLYNNQDFFWIVRGNHENFAYKFLKGELGPLETNKDLIDNWFESIYVLVDDEKLKNKFFHLFENSYDFIQTEKFIVTHAPCGVKYLGKTDSVSIKNQRTIVYPKKADYSNIEEYLTGKEEFFKFLIQDADFSQPFHIFGHVMAKDVWNYKNKYLIDTGCVVGGTLSTLQIRKDSIKPYVKKYLSKQKQKEELFPFFRVKHKEIDFNSLEPSEKGRIRWAIDNKVNFVSGTMSPCDKNFSDGDIESIYRGLEYYKHKGVKKVILQPKFMGSRCQILLHKSDNNKCKAYSRGAFTIEETRLNITGKKKLNDVYNELREKYKFIFEGEGDNKKIESILFDGELLPWNVMGKDLIETDFHLITKAIQSEINLFEETDFYDQLEKFKTKYENIEINEKTPPHIRRNIQAFEEIKDEIQPIEQVKTDLNKYNKQLEIFGSDGELEYKAFSVLKLYFENGNEHNCINSQSSNIDMFNSISKEPYAVIDLVDNNKTEEGKIICKVYNDNEPAYYSTIEKFWNYITQQKQMEGVVIKPEHVYIPGVAPYLKCRNKEYLRIVYGMDYDSLPAKHEKIFKNKNIKRKLETSIKEWELGKMLLDIPRNSISLENDKWISLFHQLVVEQQNEQELDPRL